LGVPKNFDIKSEIGRSRDC